MRLFSLPCILELGRSYTGAMTGSVYSFVFLLSCFLATSSAQEELCPHKRSGENSVQTWTGYIESIHIIGAGALYHDMEEAHSKRAPEDAVMATIAKLLGCSIVGSSRSYDFHCGLPANTSVNFLSGF